MVVHSSLLKQAVARLPDPVQDCIKRLRFRRQIRAGTFTPNEPEIAFIAEAVRPGDWVIDVGANVGHYTLPLAKAVGPSGRVIAFEPIPRTHALLAANAVFWATGNVTLINAAASDHLSVSGMSVPELPSGSKNFYRAALAPNGGCPVVCLPIDTLQLLRISLIKIDAEGHDLAVLNGARQLIERYKPALIVESELEGDVADWLRKLGYRLSMPPGSPNVIATCGGTP